MKTTWQVKIHAGFMAGIHTFPTRKQAWGFARTWERAQRGTQEHGSFKTTTLRNGVLHDRTEWKQ